MVSKFNLGNPASPRLSDRTRSTRCTSNQNKNGKLASGQNPLIPHVKEMCLEHVQVTGPVEHHPTPPLPQTLHYADKMRLLGVLLAVSFAAAQIPTPSTVPDYVSLYHCIVGKKLAYCEAKDDTVPPLRQRANLVVSQVYVASWDKDPVPWTRVHARI